MSENKSTGRKPGHNASPKGFVSSPPIKPTAPTSAPASSDSGIPVTKENLGFEGGDWEAKHTKFENAKKEKLDKAVLALIAAQKAENDSLDVEDGISISKRAEETFLTFKEEGESIADLFVRIENEIADRKQKQADLEDGVIALRVFRDPQYPDSDWTHTMAGLRLMSLSSGEDIDAFMTRIDTYQEEIANELNGEANLQTRIKAREDEKKALQEAQYAREDAEAKAKYKAEQENRSPEEKRRSNLYMGIIYLDILTKPNSEHIEEDMAYAKENLMKLKNEDESLEDFITSINAYDEERLQRAVTAHNNLFNFTLDDGTRLFEEETTKGDNNE